MTAVEKILSNYEMGTITKRERVVALARLITPETIDATLANIPEGVIQELLHWARAAPLEGGVMIGGEVSRATAEKLGAQQRIAVQAIRDWEQRNQGPGSVGAAKVERNGASPAVQPAESEKGDRL